VVLDAVRKLYLRQKMGTCTVLIILMQLLSIIKTMSITEAV
jgi:hypothetical protein